MQTVKHSSRTHCVSALTLLAAITLLASARPAHSQEMIMCTPGDMPRDDHAIVLVPDSDDGGDRGIGYWWFGLGALPAIFDLFDGGGSQTSTQGSIGGGTGSNGSWGDRFPPEVPGGNPGGDPGGNPGGGVSPEGNPNAVPEPGAWALLVGPLVAGAFVLRARRVRTGD
jgi:hypothetical protein